MLGSIWHPRFPRERAGRGAQTYPRLAEGFKLMLHREAKNCRCTRGGGGRQRFQTEGLDRDGCISSATSTAGCSEGRLKVGFDGCPETTPDACRTRRNFMIMTPSGACMISNGQTIEDLATQLSNHFDRSLSEQTGVKGGPGPGPWPAGGGPSDRIVPEGDAPPSSFNAPQEQLGLKLEAKKGPVELSVINHVEKTPTQN